MHHQVSSWDILVRRGYSCPISEQETDFRKGHTLAKAIERLSDSRRGPQSPSACHDSNVAPEQAPCQEQAQP